jgi:predicted acylesterase/phospholipase RssA
MGKESSKPTKQRALVLQGGGTLGAYEAGVLEILCKKLSEEDKENNTKNGLLFDIIAGSSIGAMNGALSYHNAKCRATICWIYTHGYRSKGRIWLMLSGSTPIIRSNANIKNLRGQNSSSLKKTNGEEALEDILNKIQAARIELKSAKQNKTP